MTESVLKLWTIDELCSQVALALSLSPDYSGQSSGRVRDIPDRRTIRYYITLGLLDRPEKIWVRTALYGRRHLLQLVAIKRLQTRGLSLAELQQRLVGLSNAGLEKLARLPPDLDAPASPSPSETAEPAARAGDFWKAAPPPAGPGEATDSPEEPGQSEGQGASAADGTERDQVIDLQGVRLDDGVTLLLSTARPVESDDLEAIRTVAAPLLKLLEKRRLLRPRQERRNA
jgi:DNA-binding transcriptional MerR regulator